MTSTSCLEIVRPRPVPRGESPCLGRICRKGSNAAAMSSAGIPMPVSRTSKVVEPCQGWARSVTLPVCVYFTAFDSRLTRTRDSFSRSRDDDAGRLGCASMTRSRPFSRAWGSTRSAFSRSSSRTDRLRVEVALPGLELGEVEDVVDHPAKCLGGLAQDAHVAVRRHPPRRRSHVFELVREQDDRVERRAQLVRHGREKVGPHAVQLRQLAVRLRALAAEAALLADEPADPDQRAGARAQLHGLDRACR